MQQYTPTQYKNKGKKKENMVLGKNTETGGAQTAMLVQVWMKNESGRDRQQKAVTQEVPGKARHYILMAAAEEVTIQLTEREAERRKEMNGGGIAMAEQWRREQGAL
jgi:hypothetical protein